MLETARWVVDRVLGRCARPATALSLVSSRFVNLGYYSIARVPLTRSMLLAFVLSRGGFIRRKIVITQADDTGEYFEAKERNFFGERFIIYLFIFEMTARKKCFRGEFTRNKKVIIQDILRKQKEGKVALLKYAHQIIVG